MSLTRRLQWLLAVLLMLALTANLLLQVQRTREFLRVQLQTHAQDTATSLALSLTPALAAKDVVTAERMIDAIFDRGYFRALRWRDVNDVVVLQRESTAAPVQVPDWFAEALPIAAPQAEALLSGGWTQHGKLELESHTGYALLALWRSFVDLLLGSVIALVALGLLVFVTVQRSLSPLHRMADAAHQFVSRRAPMQLPQAVVSELQPLAQALSQMSEQVAAQFAAQAAQVQALQQQLQCDAVTGLPNRAALLDALSALEQQTTPTTVLAVRLSNLASINAEHGFAATNTLLQELTTHWRGLRDWHWYRLSGGDWLALAAHANATIDVAAVTPAAPWQSQVVQLTLTPAHSALEHVSRIEAALQEAQQRQLPWWQVPAGEMLSTEQWRHTLQTAVREQRFRLLPAAIESFGKRLTPAVEWLARLPLAEGGECSAGQLLAHSRQLGLAREVETTLLQRLQAMPRDDRHWHLNVSASAVCDPAWQQQLLQLARQQTLSIELSEADALSVTDLAVRVQPLRAAGIGVGLDQVALSAGLLAALPRWRPDYLKLGLGLASAGPASPLLTQLTRLAQALDIAVLVPVAANEAAAVWQQAGVDGVMRPPA